MVKEKSCKERINAEYKREITELRKIWKAYNTGKTIGEYGPESFSEHGLSVDYVEPNTFEDQPEGYLRYVISWGGPSDEFQFYFDGNNLRRVEYWFMDWFDGANIVIESGNDFELLEEIFSFFYETGSVPD